MNRTSLNLPYLLLAGTVIVVIVFGFTVLQPLLGAVRDIQANIVSTQATLQERQDFLRTLDSKVADLNTNQAYEQQLRVVLPATNRMEDALRILHTAAAASSVVILQINNTSDGAQADVRSQRARGDAEVLPNGVDPLALNISFQGSYQGFRAFIDQLENSPRLMDVTTIDLQSTDQPDLLTGKATVVFYVLNNSEADYGG